jgi:hypothetical protein
VIPAVVYPNLDFLFQQMIHLTLKEVAPGHGELILDVGCGRAIDGARLGRKGAQVVGLEPGLAAGLGFYTYPAAWLGLVTVVMMMVLLTVIRRIRVRQAVTFLAFFLAARYVKFIHQFNDISEAVHYLYACIFGINYPMIEINDAKNS